MISVVVPTLNAEQTLGPLLSGLMRAAVDGLVREVIVADGGSTDQTLDVADDAGAGILKVEGDIGARLAAGCAAARSPWLLTLRQDGRPLPGWEAITTRHIEASIGQGAWFPLRRTGWMGGLMGASDGVALLLPMPLYARSEGFAAGAAEGRLARRLGRLKRLQVPVLEPR
jgi:glycosyltransferase involved in cell wall biosynthesis